MGLYDGNGDIGGGGFFVHLRNQFGACEWAFVVARVSGSTLNLKVITNNPDQFLWRPNCNHGAGKGQWHWPNQCKMDDKQMREDELKAFEPAAATSDFDGHN